MNIYSNYAMNTQPNFQARIKINKKDALGALSIGTAAVTTGVATVASYVQPEVGHQLNGADLGSLNNVESIKDYIVEGENLYVNEENNIEFPKDPNDHSAEVVSSLGNVSSITGSYLSNAAAKALYKGTIDDKSPAAGLMLPSDKDNK